MATVSRQQLASRLPAVLRAVRAADFVAVDLEMSGLHASPRLRDGPADSPALRYSIVKSSCESFAVLQLGVCCFQWDAPRRAFQVRPFSFYVWPEPVRNIDHRFLFQSSALSFLAGHGFDFNRLMAEGCPYTSREEERELLAAERAAAEAPADEMRADHPRLQQLVAGCVATVEAARAAGQPFAVLPPCSAFERALLYQELPRACGEGGALVVHVVDADQDGAELSEEERLQARRVAGGRRPRRRLRVSFGEAARAAHGEERLQRKLQEVRDRAGVRTVVDAIIDARTPVVGHNCLLDVGHIYQKFVGRLPATLPEFCAQVREVMPAVVDTKYLLSTPDVRPLFPNSSLGAAFQTAQGPYFPGRDAVSFEFPDAEGGDPDAAGAAHDAGHDAFMTGALFARLVAGPLSAKVDTVADVVGSDLANKLNLMHLRQPLDLAGPNLPLDQDARVVVSGAPAGTRQGHLLKLFAPLKHGVVRAWRLGPDEFVVTFPDSTTAQLVVRAACAELEEGDHAAQALAASLPPVEVREGETLGLPQLTLRPLKESDDERLRRDEQPAARDAGELVVQHLLARL